MPKARAGRAAMAHIIKHYAQAFSQTGALFGRQKRPNRNIFAVARQNQRANIQSRARVGNIRRKKPAI